MQIKVRKQFAIGDEQFYPAGTFTASGEPRPETVEIDDDDLAVHLCAEGFAELVVDAPSVNPEPDFYTLDEFESYCEPLGISQDRIEAALAEGAIEGAYKRKHRHFIPRPAARAWASSITGGTE